MINIFSKRILFGGRVSFFCANQKKRKWIAPQQITKQKFEDYFLVKSKSFEFLIKQDVPFKEIYVHQPDTPASLMTKPAIHIFVDGLPEVNKQEKYHAALKKFHEKYQNSFKNCKNGLEIFHLDRRIKADIRSKLNFIGDVKGKYKHHLTFKSIIEQNKQKTIEEYRKKGVTVAALDGAIIYPYGQIWLPTNEEYLQDFKQFLQRQRPDRTQTVLDIGTGSGVLSYMLSKKFKKARIIGLDNNPDAIKTVEVNAAALELKNIQPILFDVTAHKDFELKSREFNLPSSYDMIVSNPPWIVASKFSNQSRIADGVYDKHGKMLTGSFLLAKKYLKDKNSKFMLIYSDISKLIGLEKESIESLCKTHNFLIVNKYERPYTKQLQKESPLNEFKHKAKIQLYQIRKS